MKRYYLPPTLNCDFVQTADYLCGDNSLPYGGDDGPGTAESKEHNDNSDAEEYTNWGTLW